MCQHDDDSLLRVQKDPREPGSGLQKFSEDIIKRNIKEQGGSDREIEEFKRLKSYANSYRLRHVYRMFNEFKYKLNDSMTGFAEPSKIMAWSNKFNYDAHLLALEKQEEEERKKKQLLEVKKLQSQAHMMGAVASNLKSAMQKELQYGGASQSPADQNKSASKS